MSDGNSGYRTAAMPRRTMQGSGYRQASPVYRQSARPRGAVPPMRAQRPAGYRPSSAPRRRPPQPMYAGRPAQPRVAPRRARAAAITYRDLAVTAVLLLAIILITVLAIRQRIAYGSFLNMRNAVAQQDFYPGTTVEGIDVSSMSLDEALNYWAMNVEPQWSQRSISLSSGDYFVATELGYTSDYQTVLTNAWFAGRKGTLEERYNALSDPGTVGVSYDVTRTQCNRDRILSLVSGVAVQVNTEPIDAKIEGFDVESAKFQFKQSIPGEVVDEEGLTDAIIETLQAGGGYVQVPVNYVEPAITTENVSSQYGIVSQAITDASTSNKNRLANLRRALGSIDGICLEPGQSFSFNETVGERTEENGYLVAGAYGDGEVIDELGGGICQVSTTLFNAVVKADLKVTERHSHSMPVAYVDLSKDAAVNWKSKDFRFTNNSDDNVYIICELTGDRRVLVRIYGKLLQNGESITVESETTEVVPFDTEMRVNADLSIGQEKEVREGQDGYRATAYKVRWDASGREIGRQVLCKSFYEPISKIIEYGA